MDGSCPTKHENFHETSVCTLEDYRRDDGRNNEKEVRFHTTIGSNLEYRLQLTRTTRYGRKWQLPIYYLLTFASGFIRVEAEQRKQIIP